jgi:hypothetical protein
MQFKAELDTSAQQFVDIASICDAEMLLKHALITAERNSIIGMLC